MRARRSLPCVSRWRAVVETAGGDVTAFVERFDGVQELLLARSGVITRAALATAAEVKLAAPSVQSAIDTLD